MNYWKKLSASIVAFAILVTATAANATPFTTAVPGTSLTLPAGYPEAGGVAIVLVGANGNSYFQFSNPTGAFRGFNSNGTPTRFRGDPFTINDPIGLDCGFSTCSTYFGGAISNIYVRFTAYDGDTQAGQFDANDIDLLINGFNVGNWTNIPTQNTNLDGTQLISSGIGFGNRTYDTGWFSSTNPALLANILSTGQTVSQVDDADPNDNYWDFRRGPTLSNTDIVTVAPGYSLEKTADKTDFTTVGETITYSYVITNIGSVPIRQLSVSDDKIPTVSCDKTVIQDTSPGGTPDFATCTATYLVTQDDIDNGGVVNIAIANGVPDFGTLGALEDTVTVDGPTQTPGISLEKTTALSEFGAKDSSVLYSFKVKNEGNVTLTGVAVSDPLIPGLSCTIGSLAPGIEQTCTGTYLVKQSDIDVFASAGTQLANTASVTGKPPSGPNETDTSSVTLPGATPVVAMDFTKTATTADFDAVGDVIDYTFTIKNTGTVTFPDAPVVTDVLTNGATCPSGPVAPNATITCLASYTIQQTDIDTGKVDNSATATITIGSNTANGADLASVDAVRTTGLTLDKRLNSASATSFDTTGISLTYDYVLTNTGNVTLNTPVITDDKTTATCTDTTIAPNTQITCTSASYSTAQGDLNSGGVTNVASATALAEGTGATVSSNSDTVTVPANQKPEISLVKTAPAVSAGQFQVGNTVIYTYDVKNIGNVRIATNIGVSKVTITDSKFPAPFDCFLTPLNRNATKSCTAVYTFTADDIAAGVVQNTASADAGATQSAEVQVTIAPLLKPALTLTKTPDLASVSTTTDTITYTFGVTNSGDTQIVLPGQPITINDAKLLTAANCSAQPVTMDPGDSFDCVATYDPTQPEIDAGSVDNAATASFEFSQNGVTTTITSPQVVATVPAIQTPVFSFEKDASTPTFSTVGEIITYTFTATNLGNVTFTEITVTDPLIPALNCTFTDVAPMDAPTCTGMYEVTQDDMDAEVVNNTASAAAQTASGFGETKTAVETVPVLPTAATTIASIVKTADKPGFTTVDEVIIYTLAVTNDGTQTLNALTVTDALDPTYSCAITRLLPTETSSICTFAYTVKQSDLDAGQIDNVGSVSGAQITTSTFPLTLNGPTRTASFEFEKTAGSDFTRATDPVVFTFAVENTGNTTLTNVTITDNDLVPALSCVIPSILPMTTDNTTCVATYNVTQTDVDNGQFTNMATAAVTAPSGVTTPADKTSTAIVQGPAENASVQITKSSTDGVYSSATDNEVYTFSVTNLGNVTLTGLTVSDPALASYSCALDDLLPGATTTTCTGGATLTATKNFEQADVDIASFTNTATVTGQSLAKGTAVSDDDMVTVTGPVQSPALTMTKTETLNVLFDTLGQSIPYEFVVTNAGNVTLTGPITVTDDRIANVSCDATPASGIAPLGTLMCNGTHIVTQFDLDTGTIVNKATASVTQSVVAQTVGGPTIVTVQSPEVQETIDADQGPKLGIDKRVKSGSASSYSAVSDVVTFEYVVTNTGNVTLTEDILVNDDKIAGTLTCSVVDFAPLDVVTCEQIWTADQGALNDGEVTNIATADTTFEGAPVQSDSDSVTVPAVQNPSLFLLKTLDTPIPSVFDDTQTLTYKFVVTNNGNVTIDGPITIADSITTATCDPTPVGGLLPTVSLDCSATYAITSGDLELGSTTNVATASGMFDGAPVISPSSSTIFPADIDPALSIEKSVVPAGADFDDLTDTLTYEFKVKNSGGAGFTQDVLVTDNKMGTFVCRPAALGTFNVDAEHTCQKTYTVTQADLDAGFVTNEASASSIFAPQSGAPQNVVSPTDTVTVASQKTPMLDVMKSVTSGPNPASKDDVLEYTIVTTNTGNQTIAGISVTDPRIASFACTINGATPPSNVILSPTAPNNVLTCVGSYTVTQADIDAQDATDPAAQGLSNTATVLGTDPQGVGLSQTGSNVHPLAAPVPGVKVTKTLDRFPGPEDDFSSVDEELTFVIEIENTGNVTLSSTEITESLLVAPQTCTIGALAPGETDASCVVIYTVTQDDFDTQFGATGLGSSGVLNVATATAQPASPNATPEVDTDDAFAKGPDRIKEFALGKNADLNEITTVGQTVTYTYVVSNSGNVTLTEQPVVVDDKIGTFDCGVLPAGGLLPLDTVICTQPYIVTQVDMDAGGVTNNASVTSIEVTTPALAVLTIDADQEPSMTILKTPSETTNVVVGTDITYTYTITNTGNVTLTDVAVSDQHTSAAGTVALPVSGDTLTQDNNETGASIDATANGSWDTLGAGDVVTFTATYKVTQADVDQQVTLANTATLNANDPDSTALTPEEMDVTVTLAAKAPSFTVTKTGDDANLSSPVIIGDTVSFEITVANTGNQTITNIVLDDDLTSDVNDTLTITDPELDRGDADGDKDLDVGETHVYTATYTVDQVGLDAGGIENTVSVSGTDPQNTPITEVLDTPVEIDIPRNPVLAVIKSAVLNDGGDGTADANDTITYTYTISNEGNVTLYDASVSEATFSGTGPVPVPAYKSGGSAIGEGAAMDIAANAPPVIFEAIYTLTQDDLDTGAITNQATATADDPDGTEISDVSDDDSTVGNDPTVVTMNPEPALEVVKTATPTLSTPVAVGDTIDFVITVANTGNVTLSNIVIGDTLKDAKGQPLVMTMLPTYDAGDLNNDQKIDVTETWSYLASFTLTQTAIDAGGVSNSADATATVPQGGTINDVSNADTPNGDDPTDVTLTRMPKIAVIKSVSVDAGADGVVNANDIVTYTYVVSNEGNVTLFDVSVAETTFSGTDAAPSPALTIGGSDEGGVAGVLDLPVGAATMTFTATYALTQLDVDAGGIDNQATATGDDPDGTEISDLSDDDSVSGDDVTSLTIAPIASLEVVKTANTSGLSDPVKVGDPIAYTITVENTGNVTLDTVVPDDMFTRRDGTALTLVLAAPTGDAGTLGALETTETWTYTATHNLTQDDIDAGGVNNTITVAAQSPTDAPVTDTSDNGNDADGNTTDDSTDVRLEAKPVLELVKRLKAGEPATFATLNEEVEFEFEVTNAGNITITAPVVINDALITSTGGSLSCAPSPIAVGDSILCSGSYRVTQDDLDNGSFDNAATAVANQPVVPFVDGGPITVAVESDEALINVPAAQDAGIAIAKAVKSGSSLTYAKPGDQTIFEYTITNTGNVTLTSAVSVFDDKISGTLDCGGIGLIPGGMLTCEQTWTADLQDLNDGSVTNIATAQTTFDGGIVDEDAPASATVTALQDPLLTIAKSRISAVPDQFDVNTILSYSFLITNTGNVTIDGPFTVSDNLSTVDCSAAPASLDPMQTATCTSSYTIRQVDLDLGSTLNVAAASGTFGSDTVTSPTDNDIYPVGAIPALSLTKDSVPSDASFTALNDTIDYTYKITNSGGTGFNTDISIADNRFVDPIECYVDTPTTSFSIGQMITCTAQYAVTQDDLDAGFVTNEAIASTTFAPNTANETLVLSPAATKTVNAVKDPELTVLKSVTDGPSPAKVDDTLEYTLSAENTGNQTISGVTLIDPLIPILTCEIDGTTAPLNVVLAPGDILICVGTYDVTQIDVDAQMLLNTATATGADPQGETVTGSKDNTHPLDVADPKLVVTKTIQGAPASGPVFTMPGEKINFVISVKNTGNVTLNTLSISDNLPVTPATCSITSLAPGATNASCIVEYTTTQDDVNARNTVGGVTVGGFTNIATATAQPASPNADALSETGEVFVLGPDRAPAFSIAKVANVSDIAAFGDIVTYTYTVKNSGNVTLFDQPIVSDDKIANVNCAPIATTGLIPNATLECSADYTVTQADIDAGGVTNIASVASPEVPLPTVPGDAETSLTVPSVRTPAVSLTKEVVGTPTVAEGETITYLYAVENTGNVTLTDAIVSDNHTSASGTVALIVAGDTQLRDLGEQSNSTDTAANGTWDSLGPQDVVTFTATYVVTQADIDAQTDLSNTASVTTTTPSGTTPPTDTKTVDLPVHDAAPEITALKTADISGLSNPPIAGESVAFTITVTNSGNQTLDTVTLVDTLKRADGTPLALTAQPMLTGGDAGVTGDLEVDETWTYSAAYTLIQADVDGGGITNSVLARGLSPNATPVTDLSDNAIPDDGADNPTLVQIPAKPGIEGVKTITSTTIAVDEIVVFEITIANTGNVTLSSVAVATDTLLRADNTPLVLTSGPIFVSSTAGSGAGVLIPNEIATYSATYKLTQDDIDAGGISNSAVVTGTPPVGSPLTDTTDDNVPSDDNETTDLIIPSEPKLTLIKRLPTTGAPTYSAVDEIVAYEFEVTNAGNVTLDGPFNITDPLITDADGVITCAPGPILPDASVLCTGSYAITQGDLDLGTLTNVASATDGTTTSDDETLVVPANQMPAMTVVKTAEDVTAAAFIPGLSVTYTFLVTNTGNITLEDPITISDNRIDPANISCAPFPDEGIAPEGEYTCTGTYVVSSDDVNLGSVTNLASASDGETTSPLVFETIPEAGIPALDIVKTAEPNASFAEVGDEVDYTFVVTNAGTRAFVNDVIVQDDRLGTIVCFTPTSPTDVFASGDMVTCTGTDTVTQEDLDAGFVTNEAYAQTIFGEDDTTATSAPVTQTVDADLKPEITLAKTSTPNPVSAVGETLTYSLIATNSGNQTLTNIVVRDPLLPNLSCTVPELLRGAMLSCSDTYIVTQDDVDRGQLVNIATADAVTPQGTATSGTGTETTGMPASNPSMTLAKVASPDPFGAVGSTLTYVFTVANTGNTTLSNIVVTDVMDANFSCEIDTIAPGKSDATCTYAITVAQDHVDAGEIINTGAANGVDPFGTDVEKSDTITTDGPVQMPSLNVTKVVLPSASALNSEVTFQLTVVNTGNVSLTPQLPQDMMQRLNGVPVTLDQPFARVSGDTDQDDKLDVTETWIYTAVRTLVQGDLNAGGLQNSASVTATGPMGQIVSDVSDNGVNNDGNTENDPTVFNVVREPQLTVSKSAVSSGMAVGDTVTFTIAGLNTGNVDLTNLSVVDTLRRFDGTTVTGVTVAPVDVPSPLNPGSTATWSVVHTITQTDIDAGGVTNTATVTGTDPENKAVSDVSADDDPNDGNLDDDATEVLIAPVPSIEMLKTVASAGVIEGEDVVFTLTVRNAGNVTLTNVVLVDTMKNLAGDTVTPVTIAFVSADGDTPSPAGTLMTGETATYTATYTLTLADVDSGGLTNTATATATTPLGGTLSDVSDNGSGTGDTPTPVQIAPMPDLEVLKAAGDVYVLFPTVEQLTFTITVKNTGNITQTGLQLVDDLSIYSAPATLLLATYPTQVSIDGFTNGTASITYDGVSDLNTMAGNPTLEPGETGTVTIVSTYSSAAAYPGSDNTATATSNELSTTRSSTTVLALADADGDGVVDGLEGATDRDGDGIPDNQDYDPTGYFYCEDDGRILSGGGITVSGNGFTQTGTGSSGPITIVQDGSTGFFQFFSTAAGSYTLTAAYPPAGVASTARPTLGTLDATTLLPANPASIGSNEFGSTGVLADFTAAANPFYTVFDVQAGDPYVLNNNIPMTNCATVPNVLATKTADRRTAVLGETINYTLTFVNNTSQTFTNATFVDVLPAGLLFTPGSGTVDAVATAPAINGRRLEWGGLTIVPAQTITVTLAARVIAGAAIGPLTNQAWLEDATGTRQSNIATATVDLQPEPVFDCSDVIGKVFDDRNRNGYQDDTLSTSVTDNSGEPGMPGVRLVSTDGTIIRTDEYGRFSVPCAALPRDIGSNFTLKLDTRTLPTGYRVTTENPRVVRLTKGKFAKINFGVSLSNVVDIDLTANAFASGSVVPSMALEQAVDGLLKRIATEPSSLRLSYVMRRGEQVEGARARLRAVEDLIRKKWRGQGRYKLTIERTVKRLQ